MKGQRAAEDSGDRGRGITGFHANVNNGARPRATCHGIRRKLAPSLRQGLVNRPSSSRTCDRSMLRIERYLFRTATTAFFAGLFTLTAVLWVTQALKQLDLMTSKGQTILVFLAMTGLGLPFLTAVIAPVALFASVLYCLNKLNGDSELVVMSASGISTARLLYPFLALFTLVFLLVAALFLEIIPRSFDAIQSLTTRVHADFIANFARPGAFTQLEAGFVFHYRERAKDGSLRGVFIQDRRDPAQISTYIAEVGELVEKDGDTYLLLLKGSTQRPRGNADSSIITFDDYAIDLSQFVHKGDGARRPRELSTWQLLSPDKKGKRSPAIRRASARGIVRSAHQPILRFRCGIDRIRRAWAKRARPARVEDGRSPPPC